MCIRDSSLPSQHRPPSPSSLLRHVGYQLAVVGILTAECLCVCVAGTGRPQVRLLPRPHGRGPVHVAP
eukprot:1809383-Rhodomonas_salina.1